LIKLIKRLFFPAILVFFAMPVVGETKLSLGSGIMYPFGYEDNLRWESFSKEDLRLAEEHLANSLPETFDEKLSIEILLKEPSLTVKPKLSFTNDSFEYQLPVCLYRLNAKVQIVVSDDSYSIDIFESTLDVQDTIAVGAELNKYARCVIEQSEAKKLYVDAMEKAMFEISGDLVVYSTKRYELKDLEKTASGVYTFESMIDADSVFIYRNDGNRGSLRLGSATRIENGFFYSKFEIVESTDLVKENDFVGLVFE